MQQSPQQYSSSGSADINNLSNCDGTPSSNSNNNNNPSGQFYNNNNSLNQWTQQQQPQTQQPIQRYPPST